MTTARRRRCPRGAAIAAAALAAAAGGGTAIVIAAPADEKDQVDRRLERVQGRLEQARGRERVLTGQVSSYSSRIRVIETRLGPLRERSGRLQAELASVRVRLAALTSRLDQEQLRLAAAQDSLARQRIALAERLRSLYTRKDPDPLLVLLETGSLAQAMATSDALQLVAEQDRRLAEQVRRYAERVRDTRDRIAAARVEVVAIELRARAAAAEVTRVTRRLETQEAGLKRLRGGRMQLLGNVRGDRRTIEAEARNLQERSSALGERIRRAQGLPSSPSSVPSGPPSASGMAWPVNGTLTSGFGMRWGRMHEGIDIAGASGTPIGAAKAGTVIVAGWNGGYGNLVVVDHGGGISTAYAHMSSIAVSVGQQVGQGSTLGGMGTTGHSTGVHLHFEVRVNGGAVNPIGYL